MAKLSVVGQVVAYWLLDISVIQLVQLNVKSE